MSDSDEVRQQKSKLHKAIQEYVNFVDSENTVLNWVLLTEETSIEHEQNDRVEINTYSSPNIRGIERRGLIEMGRQKEINRARNLGVQE